MRSIPHLMNLQQALLETDPAEFAFAVLADERVIPQGTRQPTLDIVAKPPEGSRVEAWERRLPMQLSVQSHPEGLPVAPSGRRWMVYRLTLESRVEMALGQARWKAYLRDRPREERDKRGSLSVGISQQGLAPDDPRLAHTRWETWLQSSRRDGFFELWSGTISDLRKQALSR